MRRKILRRYIHQQTDQKTDEGGLDEGGIVAAENLEEIGAQMRLQRLGRPAFEQHAHRVDGD